VRRTNWEETKMNPYSYLDRPLCETELRLGIEGRLCGWRGCLGPGGVVFAGRHGFQRNKRRSGVVGCIVALSALVGLSGFHPNVGVHRFHQQACLGNSAMGPRNVDRRRETRVEGRRDMDKECASRLQQNAKEEASRATAWPKRRKP
jgi:hypothetical protein